mmetsp:Transcript_17683/g.55744  ORF Transcript_17683/g.55744 Transcript_17683/m.55744 type:complete len:320 (+) Transcript_17683:288-1247(+)
MGLLQPRHEGGPDHLRVHRRSWHRQAQVAGRPSHDPRVRSLGEEPHGHPAVRVLQRHRLRELGERLGHLRALYAARRRGVAPHLHALPMAGPPGLHPGLRVLGTLHTGAGAPASPPLRCRRPVGLEVRAPQQRLPLAYHQPGLLASGRGARHLRLLGPWGRGPPVRPVPRRVPPLRKEREGQPGVRRLRRHFGHHEGLAVGPPTRQDEAADRGAAGEVQCRVGTFAAGDGPPSGPRAARRGGGAGRHRLGAADQVPLQDRGRRDRGRLRQVARHLGRLLHARQEVPARQGVRAALRLRRRGQPGGGRAVPLGGHARSLP